MDDEFWDKMPIPFQQEDGQFQFANPVVVSQKFLLSQGQLAYLGKQQEVLTEQIGSYTLKLEDAKDRFRKLRKRLLAKHYKDITKSASSEIQDAFVMKCALAEGEKVFNEFTDLETEIRGYEVEIARRAPRLEQFRNRQRTLALSMEWAKEYLNFEKHITRLDK